ncbi:DNA-binding transcriptional regulator, ArsR family [Micromonospora eburnea]|uniref:DNA-binding transcriptional regulator, ArsR family n=1 Tax=Micromonospora eburnea TaxID=227316 RepID=A0A1C6UF24_9ACTN|nr:DNA-binding transcriptional regulator, ArsR family [Micromonospora eburnea]
MLSATLGVGDLANIRFAVSPLWEAVASVRVVKHPDWFPEHLPWHRQVQPRLSAVDWRLLADLVPVPTVVIPGFVCSPPPAAQPTIECELAALAATPPEVVRAGLDELPGPRSPRLAALYADPPAGLARLADTIAAYVDAAIAPYWPRMRTLLEREVLVGAQFMAADGVRGLLNRIDRYVSWDDGTLHVDHLTRAGAVDLDGRGLLLVPSVFGGSRVWSNLSERATQPVLRYPARGVGTLWERGTAPASEALARVLGRTRATLLHELAVPSATTELARRCGLAAGTVSHHLTALRDAGLVGTHRAGRFLLYARTSSAEALIAGAAPTGETGQAE